MTYGILYCSYGSPEMVDMSLEPWIEAKKRHNLKIAAVSGIFKEYFEMGQPDNDTKTEAKLNLSLSFGDIDYVYIQNPFGCESKVYETEADIRDKGLQYLLKAGVETVILWDGDEKATSEEIDKLLTYIKKDPLVCWYRFYYKNLTFNSSTYTKGFCPPRVFRVNYQNKYTINSCIWDNDFSYKGLVTRDIINYQQLPSKTIPDTILEPLHYTWNDYERSRLKIFYQQRHFQGSGCSFRVNEEEKRIEWNLDHFKKTGQTIPQTYKL